MRRWRSRQRLLIGAGALEQHLARLGAAGPVLVLGGTSSWEASGAAQAVDAARSRGLRATVVQGIRSYPTRADVDRVSRAAREVPHVEVIAIGGGSVLDVAKLSRVDRGDRTPLTLVPTTAGTGSEVTQTATYWSRRGKHAVDHPDARAELAIVDPVLSASQPPALTVATGLDALSQAVESAWAPTATPGSRRCAQAALAGMVDLLETCVVGPTSESRLRMARAATFAGLAIDTTRTTAAHAFSYPLTVRYGVPHGVGCALGLCWLMDLNQRMADEAADEDLSATIATVLGLLGQPSVAGLVGAIRRLLRHACLPDSPAGWGVVDLEAVIAEAAGSERWANNPVPITPGMALDAAATTFR